MVEKHVPTQALWSQPLETTATIGAAKSEDKSAAERAWAGVVGLKGSASSGRRSNDRKQPAGSRSEIYEARNRMGLFGGKARKTVEECHFFVISSPSSDAYFPSCKCFVHHSPIPRCPPPHTHMHPRCLTFPQSPADKPLSISLRHLAPYFMHNPVDRFSEWRGC